MKGTEEWGHFSHQRYCSWFSVSHF